MLELDKDLVCLGESESELQEMNFEADRRFSQLHSVIRNKGGDIYALEGDYKYHVEEDLRYHTGRSYVDIRGVSVGGGNVYVELTGSPITKFRLLVHEYAHDLLKHVDRLDPITEELRIKQEVQSDMTAFCVCAEFGIDFSLTTFSTPLYLLSHGATPKTIAENSEIFIETSQRIITEINQFEFDSKSKLV